MKKLFKIISFLLIFSGCSKELEKYPQAQLTDENIFTIASDFDMAIDAVYVPLTNRFRGGWDWGNGGSIPREWVVGDVMSDDAVKGGGGLGDLQAVRDMQLYNIFPTNDNLLGLWRYNYKGIHAANLFLAHANDKVPGLDASKMQRMTGEAYFLRAFYYFRLVINFGSVPLLVPEKNMNDNTVQASIVNLYAQIEDDLNKAAGSLPPSYPSSDYQRVTKGAAHALLAKTFLYRQQWQKCIDEIVKVDNGTYSLLPNFANNFNGVGEQGGEAIFVARHDAGFNPGRGNILNAVFAPRGKGWGFNIPTQDLVNEFEAGDPRKGATIFQDGDTWVDGSAYVPGTSVSGYNMRKFASLNNPLDDANVDFIYIRLADVLLWKAECYANLGKLTEAKTELERVRARARSNASNPATALPVVTSNVKEDVIKAIQHERRVELAFECHRYYDLVRWGIAAKILAKSSDADPLKGFKDYGNGWQPANAILPIPQTEIDLLKLKQNSGY